MLLDSGTAYAYAPSDLVNALYQNVPGATIASGSGKYCWQSSHCSLSEAGIRSMDRSLRPTGVPWVLDRVSMSLPKDELV